MKRFIHANKTRLLLLAGALFVVCVTPAAAQNDTSQLMSHINQLENQVQTLSRAVYRGDKAAMSELAASTAGANPTAVAGFEVRISQVEEKQQAITGQLEKITYEIQQLKTRFERMQADIEQRFQQGSGGAAPSSPVVMAAPAAAPVNQLGTLPSSSQGSNGPAEALYERAFANIRDMKYDDAEGGFKKFIEQYPGHPLASNAQYWLGETYYVRGDFKQAAKTFAQGYQNFPKSSKAEDSLLKLGLSLSKLGKKDDACLSLRQLQKEVADEANPLRRKAVQEIKQLGCQ